MPVGGYGAALMRIIHIRLNRHPTLPPDASIEDGTATTDEEIAALREQIEVEGARGIEFEQRLAGQGSVVAG